MGIFRRNKSTKPEAPQTSSSAPPVAVSAEAVARWNQGREAFMTDREIDLCMGYVPQVLTVADPTRGTRTAILATPSVQYVFPEVDVIYASDTPSGPFRSIEFGEFVGALSGFKRCDANAHLGSATTPTMRVPMERQPLLH